MHNLATYYVALLASLLFLIGGASPAFAQLMPGGYTPQNNATAGSPCDPSNTSACASGLTCQSSGVTTTGYVCAAPASTNSLTPNGQGTPGSQLTPNGQTTPGSGLQNPLGFSDIPGFLNAILGLVIKIGGVVIVLMLVYIGFLFVTAQGREEKIKEAREALFWTVIGALVLLGAQAISTGIQATVSALQAGT
jgi:hypothetical protein